MKRRAPSGFNKTVADVCRRELGDLSSRKFSLRLAASEDLVLRLDMYKKLEKHGGCVNTVSFNADGHILVSGSDDRQVILWDWEIGKVKLSFDSGHSNNVFQAKIMPYSDDRSIVTCAADGQVRHAQILDSGKVQTSLLGEHHLGRAHKLAIEPGSPHIFYSCGEDGSVQHFDLRTVAATELFTCQQTERWRNVMRFIQLNAITIDPRNPNLFAVAGSDEYTRVYDIRKYKWNGSANFGQPANYFCPPHLIGDQQIGVTGLAFSEQSELLVSYNDENIYLFTREMGLGSDPLPSSPMSMGDNVSEVGGDHPSGTSSSAMDVEENIIPQAYKGHRNRETVKGVSFFGPKCEYVVSGSDCGRIFIWKKKGGELIRVIEGADRYIVNCIEAHPHTMALASSGIEHDIKIWTPKALERAKLPEKTEQVLPRRIRWFCFGGDHDRDDYLYDDDDDSDDYFGEEDVGNCFDDEDDEFDDEDDDEDDSDDDDNNDDSDDNDDDDDGNNNDANDNDNGVEGHCDDDKIDRYNSIEGCDDCNGDHDFELLSSAETQG